MTRLARLLLASTVISLTVAVPARAQKPVARTAAPSLVVATLNTTAAAERASAPRVSVRPNDVLRYTLTFTNSTSRALGNVELKDAMPAGVHFVGGSTHASRTDARVEFSADGGKSWSAQPMETVMVAGQPTQRAVSADRYTHVRWMVAGKVAPGATVTADFEARVDGAGA